MEVYYYNGNPLQLSYRNDYTLPDKLNIIKQIEMDFENGMLSTDQMRWIILNKRYGSFTVERIIDKLMFDKKIKYNPVTNDKRTFAQPKKPFDL
jgi:hypothetical protein|tara:strand:- start:201 stop:482 length:282 start_codon:yes stop_codon:yes gene_type:complete